MRSRGHVEAPSTHFAPAERADPGQLFQLASRTVHDPVMKVVLESVGGYLLLLDDHRQILAANRELLNHLGASAGSTVVGLRPGEALGCCRAENGPGGCGTSPGCHNCGAVLAILASQAHGHSATGECCIPTRTGGRISCIDFDVKATPLRVGDDRVIALVLHDVTASRRRAVLERLFIHDLRNLTTGLVGWGGLLAEEEPGEAAMHIVTLSQQLERELEDHAVVHAAETGALTVARTRVEVSELLGRVAETYRAHPCSAGRSIRVRDPGDLRSIDTDARLASRVLGNMVKNALEAVPGGEEVTLGGDRGAESVVLWVHNHGEIPHHVAKRVFRDRFSTKGSGRGLGTHAIRLIGEVYLGGRVTFTTGVPEGTRFSIELPAISDSTLV